MPIPVRDFKAAKTITFTGAAGLGAVGTVSLFTVSGDVLITGFVGKCTTNLTEAAPTATVVVGTATTTNHFLTVQNAVDIDADELWGSSVSRATTIQPNTTTTYELGAINQNIIITVGAQNVTAGVVEFTCFWRPVSIGASVVPA